MEAFFESGLSLPRAADRHGQGQSTRAVPYTPFFGRPIALSGTRNEKTDLHNDARIEGGGFESGLLHRPHSLSLS